MCSPKAICETKALYRSSLNMATSPISAPAPAAPSPKVVEHAPSRLKPTWQKYGTPLIIFLLALAVIGTITRNWNAWEGGHVEQVTNDAYVRGDLTPLSTKIAGIVREVSVSDFQTVHRGDLLVKLDDDDYRAQVAQAIAAVEAAKAAIENNRRQKQLQQAKVDRALAGVNQAEAEIAAAQAGIQAAQADIDRALPERRRQENLIATNSTTQQKVEQATSADESSRAQLV